MRTIERRESKATTSGMSHREGMGKNNEYRMMNAELQTPILTCFIRHGIEAEGLE
jgi:hypothetical protein